MNKYLIILFAFSVGCASNGHRQSALARKSDNRQLLSDSQIQKRQREEQIARDQYEKEMILKKRRSLGAVEITSIPQKKINILEMPTPDNLQKLSEGQLFAEMTDRYQAQDRWAFEVRYRLFIQKFIVSARLDEAYYMKGMMELTERNYGVSLVSFNRILKDHPFSKKAPAALFAKGIAYKKMNLSKEAGKILSEVGVRYPGSPEAFRAQNEMKLLRK